MSTATLALPAPSAFSFHSTLWSHGWFDLLPFAADSAGQALSLSFEVAPGRVLGATVRATPGGVTATLRSRAPLSARHREAAASTLRSALRLDLDLEPFYLALEREPRLAWVRARGAGRLLRAPTAWEDLVKLLLTTNCSWSLTRAMTRNLVLAAGPGDDLTGRAFPGPAALAERDEGWFRDVVRCGYRAGALLELSRRVLRADIDPERWREPGFPPEQAEREIAGIRGAGPYVVGSMMRLLGRYQHLALDSWGRARWARLQGKKKPPPDAAIARALKAYGEWRGLVLWMHLTEDWYSRGTWSPV